MHSWGSLELLLGGFLGGMKGFKSRASGFKGFGLWGHSGDRMRASDAVCASWGFGWVGVKGLCSFFCDFSI